ncbi:transmembrane domain-containing protein [Noumeavirus]|uniref:transmembrane domain-containing protein n=1 Tax=Noumeavirus TaxID=1955558 RepID=UPI000982F31A|nr:transmembrane domain-containing protein [Noumeavirus]AQM73408.1 transmembrane domain-containing protein [Noumeavirus]
MSAKKHFPFLLEGAIYFYVGPMTWAGAAIAWGERNERPWYVVLPRVCCRTLLWPFYIKNYV